MHVKDRKSADGRRQVPDLKGGWDQGAGNGHTQRGEDDRLGYGSGVQIGDQVSYGGAIDLAMTGFHQPPQPHHPPQQQFLPMSGAQPGGGGGFAVDGNQWKGGADLLGVPQTVTRSESSGSNSRRDDDSSGSSSNNLKGIYTANNNAFMSLNPGTSTSAAAAATVATTGIPGLGWPPQHPYFIPNPGRTNPMLPPGQVMYSVGPTSAPTGAPNSFLAAMPPQFVYSPFTGMPIRATTTPPTGGVFPQFQTANPAQARFISTSNLQQFANNAKEVVQRQQEVHSTTVVGSGEITPDTSDTSNARSTSINVSARERQRQQAAVARARKRRNSCLCEQINCKFSGLCRVAEDKAGENHWLYGSMYQIPPQGSMRCGIDIHERWLSYFGIDGKKLQETKFQKPELRWTHFPEEFFKRDTPVGRGDVHDNKPRRRRLKYVVRTNKSTNPLDIIQEGKHEGMAIPVPSVTFEGMSQNRKRLSSASLPSMSGGSDVVDESTLNSVDESPLDNSTKSSSIAPAIVEEEDRGEKKPTTPSENQRPAKRGKT